MMVALLVEQSDEAFLLASEALRAEALVQWGCACLGSAQSFGTDEGPNIVVAHRPALHGRSWLDPP
jgi:hypothetical protein